MRRASTFPPTVAIDAITPKFVLEYETAGGTLLYGKVTKGFKSGVVKTARKLGHRSGRCLELRTRLRGETDGVFGYSVSVFYYDYTNLHGFVNENSIVETINAASARNYGQWKRPSARLRIRRSDLRHSNAAYLISATAIMVLATRPAGSSRPVPTSRPVRPSGNRLANALEFTVAVFADHTVDLHSGTIDPSADLNFQDEVFFTEFTNRDARQEALQWPTPASPVPRTKGGRHGLGQNIRQVRARQHDRHGTALRFRIGWLAAPTTDPCVTRGSTSRASGMAEAFRIGRYKVHRIEEWQGGFSRPRPSSPSSRRRRSHRLRTLAGLPAGRHDLWLSAKLADRHGRYACR